MTGEGGRGSGTSRDWPEGHPAPKRMDSILSLDTFPASQSGSWGRRIPRRPM